MTDTWLSMTACDLGRAINEGEIGPVDLTEIYLSSARENAYRETVYARMTAERATAEAQASAERARLGTRLSLLDGVPISWKDLFDTGGTATEAGSKLLKDRVPTDDALVLKNAAARGLVCLGKTHMTELAFSGLGINTMTQTPPNALNANLAPGGSSSGAAVSTKLGMAAAGIGSDTGGSVRIPAAWNNLVGLKTTSGLLSLDGVVPLCARFDTVGPLCRSVEDAAHLTAAMGNLPVPDLKHATLKGMRLAICTTVALDDCDPGVIEAFDQVIAKVQEAGVEVIPLDIPEAAEALELASNLFTSEAYGTWGSVIEANPNAMSAPVRDRFRIGRNASAADFVVAWQKLDRLRVSYAARVASFDSVVLPTSPILPPVTERLITDETYFSEKNLLALRNTRIGNLMGLCAITLPTGKDHCGFMMMGRPMEEAALLRRAAALESLLITA